MITPEYCVTMAAYNQWQNNSLRDHVKAMDEAELRQDRGAFFGSILATLNHILWADLLWLNRLDASQPTPDADRDHTEATANGEEWSAERFRVDGAIREWARGLKAIDLTGTVTWYSYTYQKEFHHPRSLCITHMFNHQTHHRGQVHAMLTAAGRTTMDTDLIFLPEH